MHPGPDRQSARPGFGRALLCAVCLWLATACAVHDEGTPSPICLNLDFQGALIGASPGDVFLERAEATCSTVEIDVVVADLTEIWTVGFDLRFPADLVRYEGFALGSLLPQGAVQPPIVLVKENASGLQVTLSRLPPDPAVDAVGKASLIRIRFTKVAIGSGVIDFDDSPSSQVSEVILDGSGGARPASFGPGHGGVVIVP